MNTLNQKILLIFPEIPYPLRTSGISIRYLPIIQWLSKRYLIDIIIISNDDIDITKIEALRTYCRKVSIIRYSKPAKYNLIRRFCSQVAFFLPWTPPTIWVVHNGQAIASQITELTSGNRYYALICVATRYIPYLNLKSIATERVIHDFIDSPSLSFERYANETLESSILNKYGYWKKKSLGAKLVRYPFLRKYEYWKIKRWEVKLLQESTASIYISPVDANAIPPEIVPNCVRYIIPNGISIDSYTTNIESNVTSPNVGFLGNMSYRPNIEAALWLYEKVYLPLRSKLPDLSLYIIGRDPIDSILKLGLQEGVHITGTVDNIWPYINAIDVFVLPIWSGVGLKNKILEVMYAKRAVITTPSANEGIGAIGGQDLLICTTPQEFRDNIIRLLFSPSERNILGKSANRFVTENFSWDRILKDYEKIIIG